MSDPVVWSVAVILVGAGVVAEGCLAWSFVRAWREGLVEQRARRARWKAGVRAAGVPSDSGSRAVSDGGTSVTHRGAVLACVGLAASGMTSVAVAQSALPQGDAGASGSQVVETGQVGQVGANAPGESVAATGDAAAVGSALSVQLNLDFTNAYFYRGIRQQDKGVIVQPAAKLTVRLLDDEAIKLDGFFGTWNSFGPNGGTQTSSPMKDWYESDVFAGLTLTHDKVTLTTSYTLLTSPSDAFQDVQELGFVLALDDSAWLRAWALKPYAMVVFETGANGSDSADLNQGVYLELGIAPGFTFDVAKTPIAVTFPVSVGWSLSDYYKLADGSDEVFGFAQIGAKASIPLGEPGRLGAWTLNAGVSVMLLGDHTRAFNNGKKSEVIGTVGVQWSF